MPRFFIALTSFLIAMLSSHNKAAAFSSVGFRTQQSQSPPAVSLLVLGMGKGLNKTRNKQADLQRKLQLAKQQKQEQSGENENAAKEGGDNQEKPLSEKEIKERNDRLRFEELLKKEGAKVMNDYSSDGYLNRQQEEEEIQAARAGVDRIFEGDPAPTDCFESLVDVTTEKILAKKGAQRVVPWLTAGPQEDDYRVIISDPRNQSPELHQAIKDLQAALPQDIKSRLFYVNADTPAENRRWLKKNGMTGKVQIYSDTENRDWMKAYTALGDKRWSMTMFIIAQGKVMKIAREMDVYNTARTITNAVKASKKDLSRYL